MGHKTKEQKRTDMRKILLLTLLISPFICNSQEHKLTYPEKVLINGKLATRDILQRDITNAFGKPDSFIYNKAECGSNWDVEDSIVLYNNIVFEKKQDTLAFVYFNFTPSDPNFIQFDEIKLTAGTTIEEIETYFLPFTKSDITELEKHKKSQLLTLHVSRSMKDYDSALWYLYFVNGKLSKIKMWIAC
jgi:hypothetical protein